MWLSLCYSQNRPPCNSSGLALGVIVKLLLQQHPEVAPCVQKDTLQPRETFGILFGSEAELDAFHAITAQPTMRAKAFSWWIAAGMVSKHLPQPEMTSRGAHSAPESNSSIRAPRKQVLRLVIKDNALHLLLVAHQAGKLPRLELQSLHRAVVARQGHDVTWNSEQSHQSSRRRPGGAKAPAVKSDAVDSCLKCTHI